MWNRFLKKKRNGKLSVKNATRNHWLINRMLNYVVNVEPNLIPVNHGKSYVYPVTELVGSNYVFANT